MPQKHLSVRKRHRQSLVRRAANRSVKSKVRAALKEAQGASGDAKAAAYKSASAVVDKAAAGRVIHKKKAARIKSRLAKRMAATK